MAALFEAVPAVVWRWLAIGLVGLSLYGTGRLQSWLEGERKINALEAKIEAAGDAQNNRTAAENKRLAGLKKESDDAYNKVKGQRDSARAAFNDWMRKNPSSGIVPGSDAASGSPDAEACFDPAILDRGIGAGLDRFKSRLGPLVQRGKEAEQDLNLALTWALNLNQK